jgi:hypothetical protein
MNAWQPLLRELGHGVRVEPIDPDRHDVKSRGSEPVDVFVRLALPQPRKERDQGRTKLRRKCFCAYVCASAWSSTEMEGKKTHARRDISQDRLEKFESTRAIHLRMSRCCTIACCPCATIVAAARATKAARSVTRPAGMERLCCHDGLGGEQKIK